MKATSGQDLFPGNPILSTILKRVGELAVINGNLLSASEGKKKRSLLVTSSIPGEGCTTTCLSMAYSLSTLTNQRILLLDGHINKPQLHALLEIDTEAGLTDYALSTIPEEEAIYPTRFSNLFLMPRGKQTEHSMDVFTSPRFQGIRDGLAHKYDYLIMDSPPFLTSSDVTVAVSHFDAVVLVVQCNRTKKEVVELVIDKISKAGGRVLGIVLNRREYYIPKFLYR